MPDTLTPNVMAAAREIAYEFLAEPCREVDDDFNVCAWKVDPDDISKIAAILAPHFAELERKLKESNDAIFESAKLYRDKATKLGDAERVLRAAAEWVADDREECPFDYGCDSPWCDNGENCIHRDDFGKCWLEYWKKEAERCEK